MIPFFGIALNFKVCTIAISNYTTYHLSLLIHLKIAIYVNIWKVLTYVINVNIIWLSSPLQSIIGSPRFAAESFHVPSSQIMFMVLLQYVKSMKLNCIERITLYLEKQIHLCKLQCNLLEYILVLNLQEVLAIYHSLNRDKLYELK